MPGAAVLPDERHYYAPWYSRGMNLTSSPVIFTVRGQAVPADAETDPLVLFALREAGVPATPGDPLLDYGQVSALLEQLGSPAGAPTLRGYKRFGVLPVPDLQLGGHEAREDDKLIGWNRTPREPQAADPERSWTVTEKVGGRYFWLRSTIVAWNAARPGPGWWRGSQ